MTCEHLITGICTIATRLAGNDIFPIVAQCEYCTEKAEPSQSINKVTVSIAISGSANPEAKARVLRDYRQLLAVIPEVEARGPGTELKKLISWFHSPPKRKCNCKDRIQKMNYWGPDKCEQRMETIVRWLKHSAKTQGVLYSRMFMKIVIRIAIARSRRTLKEHS